MDAQAGQEKHREEQTRLEEGLVEAREELAELNQRVIDVVRRRPGTCLLLALAAGYVIGRIASR